MAQVAVPVVSKLLLMRDESVEEEADEMVGWPLITAHLSEWTDGRKVVGASSLGLDGKTHVSAEAEESHIRLAIDILERALTNTCSKDERKPLLMLLGKLQVIPSVPNTNAEDVETLHGLVVEAVEGKLGTDATQRNFLAKLEAGLTKALGELENVRPTPDGEQDDDEGEESDATITPGRAAETENETSVEPEAEADVRPQQSVSRSVSRETESVDGDGDVEMRDDEEDEEEEEEDDTMLAGMQGEGTRIPLEFDDDEDDDDEEEEESAMESARRKRVKGIAVTEDDIVEDLLDSEMSE